MKYNMHNRQQNFKLKLAVISALSVYTLSASGSAFALGLGAIDVKSHLGQPLRATVKIQGAGELKGDGCFKLINDANLENVLNSANFKLSKILSKNSVLTLSGLILTARLVLPILPRHETHRNSRNSCFWFLS